MVSVSADCCPAGLVPAKRLPISTAVGAFWYSVKLMYWSASSVAGVVGGVRAGRCHTSPLTALSSMEETRCPQHLVVTEIKGRSECVVMLVRGRPSYIESVVCFNRRRLHSTATHRLARIVSSVVTPR